MNARLSGQRLMVVCVCAFLFKSSIVRAEDQAKFVPPRLHDIAGSPYQSRQVIKLGPSTRMIIGKPNDLRSNEPDVGNIVLHRAGDTLYIVDSGALESYRPVILRTARELGRVKTVYLFNTHAHTDHIANNDLLWQIPADTHILLMPRLTKQFASSIAEYYARGTGRIQLFAPAVPELVQPKDSTVEYWSEALAPFTPWRPMIERAATLEQFPLQRLELGQVREFGYRITDDAYVLPSRGHSADSVVVLFPKIRLLCMGDETNRTYHIFLDGDGVNSFGLFQRVLSMLDAGVVSTVVDSHHFHVFNVEQSKQWFSDMLANDEHDQRLLLKVLRESGERGLKLNELIDQLAKDPWWANFYGRSAKSFPIAIPMVLLKRIRDMGVEEVGEPPHSRFRLRLDTASVHSEESVR
jgi:glyoxylase-like metal-dependent hydrolase (beta-lactamase superfamily II)